MEFDETQRFWYSSVALVVGTLGLGPTPLAHQNNLRASKGKGPDISRPTNAEPILHPDISRGFGSDISRPTNARPTFRLGAWGFHSPDSLFSSGVYFQSGNSPKQSCQPNLHFTSVSSFINLHRRLPRNREVLLIAVLSGRWLRKGKNESPFPK